MPLELFHVGETLVAEILSRLQAKGALAAVRDMVTDISLEDDLSSSKVEVPARFLADSASLVVRSGARCFSLDGAQTIDVLCAGGNGRAVPIEIKLGETRMAAAQFHDRFCAPCQVSRHRDPRLRGSMVAVLERNLPFTEDAELVAQLDHHKWVLSPKWWLVVRRHVWESWQAAAFPISNARVAAFEDLARTYRSIVGQFDNLVTEMIGSEFADRWRVNE